MHIGVRLTMTGILNKALVGFLFSVFSSCVLSVENPEVYSNKELKLEMGGFGLGVVEAYRGLNKPKKTTDVKSITSCDLTSTIMESGNGYELYWFSSEKITNTRDPFALKISKRNFKLPSMLVIGNSNRENIIEALGLPASETGSNLKYFLPGYAGDDEIIFSLKNGIIESVSWCWFFD